jgi:lipoate-protein ligase A
MPINHSSIIYWADIPYFSPQHSLAVDDCLLDLCDKGDIGPTIRFWEPTDYFVVLGHGNRYQTELYVDRCYQDNVKFFRRQSGGGTVLQGPGVLNYSFILPLQFSPQLSSITHTTTFILEHITQALNVTTTKVTIRGISDITIGDKKICGNAQRRKRRALLFHGCFLLSLDLALIDRYLCHPSKEPSYRKKRTHSDFLTHLPLSSNSVIDCFSSYFSLKKTDTSLEERLISSYINDVYNSECWNTKF